MPPSNNNGNPSADLLSEEAEHQVGERIEGTFRIGQLPCSSLFQDLLTVFQVTYQEQITWEVLEEVDPNQASQSYDQSPNDDTSTHAGMPHPAGPLTPLSHFPTNSSLPNNHLPLTTIGPSPPSPANNPRTHPPATWQEVQAIYAALEPTIYHFFWLTDQEPTPYPVQYSYFAAWLEMQIQLTQIWDGDPRGEAPSLGGWD